MLAILLILEIQTQIMAVTQVPIMAGNNDSAQEPSQTPSTNPDSGTTQDPSNDNNNSSGSNGTNNQPSQGDTDVGWADVPD